VRCHQRALEWLLTQAGLPHTPAMLWAAYQVHVLELAPTGVGQGLGLPGIIGPLKSLQSPKWPADPLQRLAVRYSLPTWIAREWIARFDERPASELADALNHAGPITLRAAPSVGGRDVLAQVLADSQVPTRPGRWCKDALHCEVRPDIRGSDAWRRGDFEVQDEGSQLIAVAVGAQPGETIVDLCAGSGGKTLAIAAATQDLGIIHACDIDKARLSDLRGRVTRRALVSVRIHQMPEAMPPTGADRVLVDAPCSAVGTWRRGPDRRWRILEAESPAYAALQLKLLIQGAGLLRPGGRLVYATCSLLWQENQAVAAEFLRTHPDFMPAPSLPEVFGNDSQVELRPDLHGTDGFFIAAFVRRC
jgi:16S rRNA (cytosine967-C5)-methyltransferase